MVDVLLAWYRDPQTGRGRWLYFPFAGGLYDQELTNALTWDIWTKIADDYTAECKEMAAKPAEGVH